MVNCQHTVMMTLYFIAIVANLQLFMCRYLCEGLYNWLATTLSRANTFVVEYDMMTSEWVIIGSLNVIVSRMVPAPPAKSWIFFLKIPGPGKSWKLKLNAGYTHAIKWRH